MKKYPSDIICEMCGVMLLVLCAVMVVVLVEVALHI